MSQTYFAVTTPGLEPALIAELRRMKAKKLVEREGGVEFQATNRGFYQALLWSRVAHKMYLRAADLHARDLRELYQRSNRTEWERIISPGAAVYLRAVSHGAMVGGTGAIANAVADGLQQRYLTTLHTKPPEIWREQAPPEGQRTVEVLARGTTDRVKINIEGAGRAMYERGWRERTGAAPLRASVAAALLELAGWTPSEPLVDPMCGSGTIPIEAARRALGLLPRLWTNHAVRDWANFDQGLWDEIAASSPEAIDRPEPAPLIRGGDADKKVARWAAENAARAGVAERTSWGAMDLAQIRGPSGPPGLLIANPPYGARLKEGGALETLIAALPERFADWRAGLLLPAGVSPSRPALKFRRAASFRNGGLAVHFWMHDVRRDDRQRGRASDEEE